MNNVSWFIGSNIDATGVAWSEGGRIEKVVAGRLRALARAVMQLVESKGTDMSEEDWRGIFQGDTEEFDFVIKVNKSLVKGTAGMQEERKKGGDAKFKNLTLAQNIDSVEDIGFDPVDLYLADLRAAFGHAALFFHGEGQDAICGLWRPGSMGEREWRVRLGWSSVPVRYTEGTEVAKESEREEANGEKVVCRLNRQAILVEMAVMGEGLVRDIRKK